MIARIRTGFLLHQLPSNIIKGNNKKPDYNSIPTVVFTLPSIATVGMTEKMAKAKKIDITVNFNSVPNWFNSKRLNEPVYAYKTIIEKTTDKIIGAHLIGPHADETINLFAMAMKAGLKANNLKKMLFSYPTMASDISSMV